ALKSATEARDENLGNLASTKIVTSPRKPPIIAKSTGQRNYVEAIQMHDIVFGIGPAGTGKTYLAVAMAVAALKKEQVTRIILTRPAVEAGEERGFLPGNKRSGVVDALQALKTIPGIATVYFSERDVVRHELVRAIISAYQQHRSPAPASRK